jgi:hypothetical protein
MTEPRDKHDDRQTDATADDREPEVRPELIKDLDVRDDDAQDITGGCSWTNTTEVR